GWRRCPGEEPSLVMDGVHNVSNEVALRFLVLAYSLRIGLSGRFLGSANFFKSLGLLAISGVLLPERTEGGNGHHDQSNGREGRPDLLNSALRGRGVRR